ncbi:hypothetical protein GJ699_06095 [Duganella sp. FT80W]|uniref:DUF4398 domain-containing protein n=1 Tax=Duganella guangzhouensis TaxID=2666084 RepID=A0A6I2KVR5_9BURK|nr:hypothetical protein [Duganella guangzhouensis]MRW89550.1 hypothetical protein [Duganella guangzhouensis]
MGKLMIVLTAFALTGCSTPHIAQQSANFGVGVIGEMEAALSDFRTSELESYKARQDSLKEQHKLAKSALASLANSSRMRESAGDYQAQSITQKLLANANAVATDEAALTAADNLQDQTVTALVTTLPSTKKATEDAQKSLAALGAGLSGKEHYSDIHLFVTTLKETVKTNKEKIAEAKKSAEDGVPAK